MSRIAINFDHLTYNHFKKIADDNKESFSGCIRRLLEIMMCEDLKDED